MRPFLILFGLALLIGAALMFAQPADASAIGAHGRARSRDDIHLCHNGPPGRGGDA